MRRPRRSMKARVAGAYRRTVGELVQRKRSKAYVARQQAGPRPPARGIEEIFAPARIREQGRVDRINAAGRDRETARTRGRNSR